jgi:hypothetical protein
MFKNSLIATSTLSTGPMRTGAISASVRNCFFGGVHGDDAEAVLRELRQAVEQNVILHQSKARCLNHITPPLSKNQKSDRRPKQRCL